MALYAPLPKPRVAILHQRHSGGLTLNDVAGDGGWGRLVSLHFDRKGQSGSMTHALISSSRVRKNRNWTAGKTQVMRQGELFYQEEPSYCS